MKSILSAMLSIAMIGLGAAFAGAGPAVFEPFPGDPRLEPLPAAPLSLQPFTLFADQAVLSVVFPPRVNGQSWSDGDLHADLFVLFDVATGDPVAQRPIVEAVPIGAVPGVSDRTARNASSVWQLHAVMMDPAYDPGDPAQRVDSAAEVARSPQVVRIHETNLFLNAPVVPAGTTVGAGVPAPIEAFFDSEIVTLVPFDVSDGPPRPQPMLRFEDAQGNVLGAPLLLASHAPGKPFDSPIREVWSVRLPSGALVSTGIRLNAPVVAVNGVPVPRDDFMELLTDAAGRFEVEKFPFDVPRGPLSSARSFALTGLVTPATVRASGAPDRPAIDPDGKGNVIPLILQDPFQEQTAGPTSTGPIVRIDQPALDDGLLNHAPPRLPAALEANFTALIAAGLLAPEWAPGGRPYQDRLAAVGRAYFELIWRPEQGAAIADVTSCAACHSMPAPGGASRSLFSFTGAFGDPTSNAGSMFGSGGAELLVQQLRASGVPGLTAAHGSLGATPSIRRIVANASNRHFGIQSAEFVGSNTVPLIGWNAVTDLDGDGVANEQSVGEVTAQAAYLMSLPVPDRASTAALSSMGIDAAAVDRGRTLFRRSIDAGGAGCARCHTVFHPLSGDVFQLANPRTTVAFPLVVSHHTADADDVADGLAVSAGQPGLRIYGDFRRHKMGSLLRTNGSDTRKTAELWDAGSVAPYPAAGRLGSGLGQAIRDHSGVTLAALQELSRSAQVDVPVGSTVVSFQSVTLRNVSAATLPATATEPIRVVLTGALTPGVQALSPRTGPSGTRRQGAHWSIAEPIPPSGTRNLVLAFVNPLAAPLAYGLTTQDHAGFSEAVASAAAFESRTPPEQADIIAFLRAQLIADTPGEGH